jgi:hypothetical protein
MCNAFLLTSTTLLLILQIRKYRIWLKTTHQNDGTKK